MNRIQEYLIAKIAADTESVWGRAKDRLSDIGVGGIRRKELRKIEGQIRKTKPKTKRERRVEELAGKAFTPGQYGRRAAVGAVVGIGAQALGNAIEGGPDWKKGFRPRALGRSAAVGALFGAAVPAVSRLSDIEAAKRGKF